MQDVKWSVIVAVFNEQDSILATLNDLQEHIPLGSEVLVIDGGDDRTGEIVRDKAKEMPGLQHIAHTDDRGKGHAIRTGLSLASGDVQMQFDGDGQFLAKDLRALVEPLLAGRSDVTLGSRFLPNSGIDAEATWTRDLGNWMTSAWASLLFSQRMTDVLAGVKAWTREANSFLNLKSDTFEYEVEIPAMALRSGLQVIDVPISTRARIAGESKVPVLKMGLRILWATWRFRWRS